MLYRGDATTCCLSAWIPQNRETPWKVMIISSPLGYVKALCLETPMSPGSGNGFMERLLRKKTR